MAEILLEPLDGGDTVPIPDEKTTIGRGPFLQIQDKRVSRNHATLEIKDGKLVLIPTHTNPCYHKIKGEGSQISLPKDKPLTLNHSDVFALLPDKLAYKVIYKSHSQSANGKKEDEKDECSDTEQENSEEEEKANHKNKSSKPTPVALVKNNAADEEDMAMPLEKKRELPKWMVGSSKRVNVSPTGEKSPTKTKAENASPAKDNASKPSPRGRGRPKGTAMASDDEFAGLSDDEKPKRKAVKSRQPARAKGRRSYQEISDEDYEDDFSEEEIKPKPRGGRSRARGRGRSRKADVDSDEEEESEEEEDSTPAKKPARRPRAASLKSPGYNDDYVLSDEEFFRDDSEEEYSARKKSKGDSDSDFVPDDESDEDWGVKKKSKQTPVPPRGGRGRGRGRGRGSSPKGRRGGRPPLIRTSSQKRRRYSDDDDFEEEDEDYTPRPSKRRAAATKKRYKDRDNSEESEEEDEDISEEEPPPKRTTPNKRGRKPAAAKAAAKESEEEEEEEEEEEDESKKRGRRACMFGKKCYRKNPEHFKEFCHPGDESYEEPDEEEKMALKKTRRGRPKRAANTGKKSLHDGASDDDGEPNTYDRTDSFLDDGTIEDEGEDSSPFDPADDDSDFEPEEEDIARLKREAKGFLKNKKMAKPARSK